MVFNAYPSSTLTPLPVRHVTPLDCRPIPGTPLFPEAALAGGWHFIHVPTLVKYVNSLLVHGGLFLHILVSLRLGQLLPPRIGGTTTSRVRVCVPFPHELVHSLHCLKVPTIQFCGQGVKHSISVGGFGSNCSQIYWGTTSLVSSLRKPVLVSMHFTALVLTPMDVEPHVKSPELSKRSHFSQSPESHAKRCLCSSQTLKQFLRLSGIVTWSHLDGGWVFKTGWVHHTWRVWLPAKPHWLPLHIPHGPTKTINNTTVSIIYRRIGSNSLCNFLRSPIVKWWKWQT